MDKARKHSRWALALLAVILAVQLAYLAYLGGQKAGYHMDEITHYNLANSYRNPFMWNSADLFDTWHSGAYFKAAVTVDPAHRFAFGSVIDNQRWDVHPPLSYLLLNAVCSLTPGVFSKWQGLAVNLAAFAGACVLLYFLSRQLLKSPWLALAPCLWWGFSAAAAGTAMYVRMYMLLALLSVWGAWVTVRLATRRQWSRGLLAEAFLSAFLGFMTHYYFLILLFFLFAALAAVLWLQRRPGQLWKPAAAWLAAGAAGVAVFYSALVHIFLGYRGTESFGNLLDFSSWGVNLAGQLGVINRQLFGGLLWALLLGLAVASLAFLGRFAPGARGAAGLAAQMAAKSGTDENARFGAPSAPNRQESRLPRWAVAMTARVDVWKGFAGVFPLTAAAAGYLLAVGKVAPVNVLQHKLDVDRYLMMLFPLLALLFCAFLQAALGTAVKKAGWHCAVTLALAGLLATGSQLASGVNYLYPEQARDEAASRACSGYPAFAIFHPTGYIVLHALPAIAEYSEVYVVRIEDQAEIARQIKERGIEGPVMLFASKGWLNERQMDNLLEETGYTTAEEVFARRSFTLYKLSQNESHTRIQ